MKKILIFIVAIVLSVGAYSQDLTKTNLRQMVDKINTKADYSAWIDSANYYTKEFNVLDYGAISEDGICDASSIQAAINAASNDYHYYNPSSQTQAIVLIPPGIYDIDEPDTLKSGVKVIADGAVFNIDDTHFWVNDTSINLMFSSVRGGFYYNVTPKWNSHIIHFETGTHGVYWNRFEDMTMFYPDTAIYLKANDTGGWVNANTFDNIELYSYRVGIHIEDDNSTNWAEGNLFSNIGFQDYSGGDTSKIGINIINGDENLFTNVMFWDIEAGDTIICINGGASYNSIQNIGGALNDGSDIINLGGGNIIQGKRKISWGNRYFDRITSSYAAGIPVIDAYNSSSTTSSTGVKGTASNTGAGTYYGVYGNAPGVNTGTNIGIYGRALNGATNYGVYSEGDIYGNNDLILANDLSISGSISTPTSITTSSIYTDALQVGDSANVVSIDDITRIGDSYRVYDDGVQLAPDIPPSAYANLSDYAVMIDTGIKFVAPYGIIPPSATTSDAATANYVYAIKFYLPYRIIVNHIGVGITTASTNDSINVGIYNSAGTIKLIDSGILSSTATGYVSSVVAGVTLGPGFYWSAYSNSNSTIRVRATVNDGIIGMGNDAYVRGRGSNYTYKGVLPATLGTISASAHNYQLIVLTNY